MTLKWDILFKIRRRFSIEQVLLIIALFSIFHTAHAQADKKSKYITRAFSGNAMQGKKKYYGLPFEFKNLNVVGYYHDKDLLKKIQKWERRKNLKKTLRYLEEYVSNFGIQNFYKDTQYLWRLGQLYEKLGYTDAAIAMYRLVLKHHRWKSNRLNPYGIHLDTVAAYYDNLISPDKDLYIPIQQYYDMVEFRKNIDTLRPPPGVLLSMGPEINSKYPDYGPTIAPNEDTLIFTSMRAPKVERDIKGKLVPNEDLYFSPGIDGYWDDAMPIVELNTQYNEGSAVISKSGKKLYFSRCEAPKGYGNCDIYSADLMPDGKWGNITNLGPGVNSVAWESQPCLSHTEDTLFFASNRNGGFGLSDIYYSVKQPNGTWGKARNLGPMINTRGNEVSPFYHPKYNVLYFSSNGHLLNFGDFDIYKSYLIDNQWTEPINLGPLVNGAGAEYYFTIDPQSKRLYYARAEANDPKNLDLYSFPLPMEAHPLSTTTFSGSLTDSAGKPMKGVVSVIDLDQGVEVFPMNIRPDGTFDFDLIKDRNYLLIITGEDFFRIEQLFFLKNDTTIDAKARSIRKQKIRFASIEFADGSAEILESMYNDLDNVKNFLIDNPEIKLKISGHTDGKGNPAANLKLSKERANAIKAYLIKGNFISPDRIKAEGYGDTRPIVPVEVTEEDRQMNRRVEFEIIAPGEEVE